MNEFLKYVNDKLVGYKVEIFCHYSGDWTIKVKDREREEVVNVVSDDMEYAFTKAYVELKDYLNEINGAYLY